MWHIRVMAIGAGIINTRFPFHTTFSYLKRSVTKSMKVPVSSMGLM
jgi:hypothetical protein